MLGLRFCARALSSRGKWGPLFIAVRGPLTVAASLVAEHRLQTRRLSNHGSRAQPLRGMRDPPRPGLEPVFPALAGRFSTTAPPGKPPFLLYRERKKFKKAQLSVCIKCTVCLRVPSMCEVNTCSHMRVNNDTYQLVCITRVTCQRLELLTVFLWREVWNQGIVFFAYLCFILWFKKKFLPYPQI